MNLVMMLGKLVYASLFITVCMLIISNALFMSNATVKLRSGGSFWLKPVANVVCNV